MYSNSKDQISLEESYRRVHYPTLNEDLNILTQNSTGLKAAMETLKALSDSGLLIQQVSKEIKDLYTKFEIFLKSNEQLGNHQVSSEVSNDLKKLQTTRDPHLAEKVLVHIKDALNKAAQTHTVNTPVQNLQNGIK